MLGGDLNRAVESANDVLRSLKEHRLRSPANPPTTATTTTTPSNPATPPTRDWDAAHSKSTTAAAKAAATAATKATTAAAPIDLLSISHDYSTETSLWSQAVFDDGLMARQLIHQSQQASIKRPQQTASTATAGGVTTTTTSTSTAAMAAASANQQRDVKIDRLNQKMRIFSERLNAEVSEKEKLATELQKTNSLIAELTESQKNDRRQIATLTQMLKMQMHGTSSRVATPFNNQPVNIDNSLDKRLNKLSFDVKDEQARLLKEWTQSISSAVQQKNLDDVKQNLKVNEELERLRLRLHALESGGETSKTRDKRVLEVCRKEMGSNMRALVEGINTTNEAGRDQIFTLERTIDGISMSLAKVCGDFHVWQHKLSTLQDNETQIRRDMKSFVASLAGLAAVRKSIETIAEEIDKKRALDAKKDSLIDEFSRNLLIAVERIASLEQRLMLKTFDTNPATHTNPFNLVSDEGVYKQSFSQNVGLNHHHLYLPDDDDDDDFEAPIELDQQPQQQDRSSIKGKLVQARQQLLFSPHRTAIASVTNHFF